MKDAGTPVLGISSYQKPDGVTAHGRLACASHYLTGFNTLTHLLLTPNL